MKTRQERKAYLQEIATVAMQMAAEWEEQSVAMKKQFDDEWEKLKKLVPEIVQNEGSLTMSNTVTMLNASQQARYKKAADDFTASYNALVLEYKRMAAEFQDPMTVNVHAPHEVC